MESRRNAAVHSCLPRAGGHHWKAMGRVLIEIYTRRCHGVTATNNTVHYQVKEVRDFHDVS
jgi:hypothetical protein